MESLDHLEVAQQGHPRQLFVKIIQISFDLHQYTTIIALIFLQLDHSLLLQQLHPLISRDQLFYFYILE